MHEVITTISWMGSGASMFILTILAFINHVRKLDDDEQQHIVATPDKDEPDIQRLEKYEKAYNHFRYSELGLTFKDYLRKIECGTWGELAE